MGCLTLVGAASIQSYIFRSNKLSEDAGASEKLRWALDWWGKPGAVNHPRVIYIGGGNAALEFESADAAREAVYVWSLEMLKAAPGLRFTAAHYEIHHGEKEAYDEALKLLQINENAPPFGADMGALPVVRECQSTGLAASRYLDNSYLSEEAYAKRKFSGDAYSRIMVDYGHLLGTDYIFPKEFENLGTMEGASQIAIVHADINGLGQRFSDTARKAEDATLFSALGRLSGDSKALGKSAFSHTVLALRGALPRLLHDQVVDCQTTGDKMFFPLRPLVDGGDDLTFVCHGKLGLSLARIYLQEFDKLAQIEEDEDKRLTACAGVLIMPGKFPFARGHKLAEDLVKSAKGLHREHGGSWLDFQVILEGSEGDLETIREAQYFDADRKKLASRPYRISPGDGTNWKVFENYWKEFSDTEHWPRSRSKKLLEALPRGDRAASELARLYEAAGFTLPRGTRCADYWDALEMLDFHVAWPREEHA